MNNLKEILKELRYFNSGKEVDRSYFPELHSALKLWDKISPKNRTRVYKKGEFEMYEFHSDPSAGFDTLKHGGKPSSIVGGFTLNKSGKRIPIVGISYSKDLAYPQISYTRVESKYQGQGLHIAEYKYLIKKYGGVLSDSQMSRFTGAGTWGKLNDLPGIEVVIYNTRTKKTNN